MYWRPFIREDDSLAPGGGSVKPRPQRYPSTYHGKLACYEGDPVYCNACKSWGVTKCVPPYRPSTDPEGRQANLDGDLCLCKCPIPPRLKASFANVRMGFKKHEIVGDALAWFIRAGHDPATIGLREDQRFLITDLTTGEALAGAAYVLECDGFRVEGVTDADGMTDAIHARSDAQPVMVYLVANQV